jgi:integrase
MVAYQTALDALPVAKEPVEIGASRTATGSISALVTTYYKSTEWRALASATQKQRRNIIERFRAKDGGKPVALLQRENIETMMATIPNIYARKHWYWAIRGLLDAAIPTLIKVNPTNGIEPVRIPKSKGHHTWTDAEIAQYRAHWPLGTQQRLVFEFALEAVSRRSEVVRIGPQHINKKGWISIERVHGSRDVEIPLTPELKAACEAMPKGHLTYIVSPNGKPRGVDGLGHDFAKWATEAGLPKRCRLHGLKKGGTRRLTEAENTTHELMAISGHKTLAMVQLYTDDADRKKLAAQGMARKAAENETGQGLRKPKRRRTQTTD